MRCGSTVNYNMGFSRTTLGGDATKHAVNGLPECRLCRRRFFRWQQLQKHIETGSCVALGGDSLTRHPINEAEQLRLHQVNVIAASPPSTVDPASASAAPAAESDLPLVRRPSFVRAQARWERWALDHAARAQLRSYCVICNMWLASSKHVKQHFHRTHAMHLGDITDRANAPCLTFKSQLTRGRACLFCHSKAGAPARHSQQCTVLFQLTVAHLYVQDHSAPDGCDDGDRGGNLPSLFSERGTAGYSGSIRGATRDGGPHQTSAAGMAAPSSTEAAGGTVSSAPNQPPGACSPDEQSGPATGRCLAAATAGSGLHDVSQAGCTQHPTIAVEHVSGVEAEERAGRPNPRLASTNHPTSRDAEGAVATIASYFGYSRRPQVGPSSGMDDGGGRLERAHRKSRSAAPQLLCCVPSGAGIDQVSSPAFVLDGAACDRSD